MEYNGAPLTGEQVPIATRIRAIDARLNQIEQNQRELVEGGLRGDSAFGADLLQRQASKNDAEHAQLLAERAELVKQLKTLRGDT